MRRLEQATPARLRRWLTIAVVLVLASLITHGNYAGSGDAVHYMVIARSLAFDRDFDLGNNYADTGGIIRVRPETHAIMGKNDVVRPVHDVGLPIVTAPAFGLAYALASMTDQLPESLRRRAKINPFIALRQLMSLLMIGLTAWLARVFFDTSLRLTGQKVWVFAWALVLALSPPLMSHGYVYLTEIPSALVALIVFARRDDVLGEQPGRRGLLLGLLTGLLVLIHVRNIGLAAALTGLIAWRVRREPARGVGFAAGLALMAAVKLALNMQFWGTLITTPHERLGPWTGLLPFVSSTIASGFGLLFDARHGLLMSAPIFLLVPAAWWLLRKESRATAVELLIVCGAYLVFVLNPVTNVHGWRGGWSPAARFLVPIVPFLAMGVPLLLASPRARRIAAVIIGAQIVLDIFFWGHPMAMWAEGPGPAPFLQALVSRDFAASLPAWDVLTTSMLLIALAIGAVWVAVTRVLVRAARLSP